jgi:hypothetical protein
LENLNRKKLQKAMPDRSEKSQQQTPQKVMSDYENSQQQAPTLQCVHQHEERDDWSLDPP